MKSKKPKITIGHVYCMDYNDHFANTGWASVDNPEQLKPVVLRGIGRLVAITPDQYNLEYMSTVSMPSPEHRIVGIMKSCVIRTIDLGALESK